MQFDPLLMLDQVQSFFSTPLGAAVALALGMFAPRLWAIVGPILTRKAAKPAPLTPTDPAAPVPLAPELPDLTGRPLLDAILKLVIRRRFPYLSDADAQLRFVEEVLKADVANVRTRTAEPQF